MTARWNALQPREKALVSGALGIIALLALWLLAWEPLADSRAGLADRVSEQQALADWLEQIEPEVVRLRGQDASARTLDDRSALSVIDSSARAAGLAGALRRIEPGAGNEVRVVFEGAEFEGLMGWLDTLVGQRPLRVTQVSADRRERGRVDVTLTLESGA